MLSLSLFLACALSSPQQGERPVLGVVRSPDDKALKDAQLWFAPKVQSGYRWLDPLLRTPGRPVGSSGKRGNFRFATPVAGHLLITAPAKVGILVACTPGVPLFAHTLPLAEIMASGGRRMSGYIRALTTQTESVTLPAIDQERSVKLPEGRYSLLIHSGDEYAEHLLELRSGRQLELTESERPVVTVDLRACAFDSIWIEGWPEAKLQPSAEGRLSIRPIADELKLCGSRMESGVITEYLIPVRVKSGKVQSPALSLRKTVNIELRDSQGRPLADASICSVQVRGSQRIRTSQSQSDAQGKCILRVPRTQSQTQPSYVLAWKKGHGFVSMQLEAAQRDGITVPDGAVQTFRVINAKGDGVSGAQVTLDHASSLPRELRTDSRGQVQLHGCHGTIQLRVSADGYQAQQQAHLTNPEARIATIIKLAPGLRISGVVFDTAGAPAPEAVIELRDTTGILLAQSKTTSSNAAGQFQFEGLPDGIYTLFASLEQGSETLSARLTKVQPERGEWSLKLKSEDPTLPGKK